MTKPRIAGRPFPGTSPCPHITGGRCTVCLAMDEIASIIETADDSVLFKELPLSRKDTNRIYRLATGQAQPKGGKR